MEFVATTALNHTTLSPRAVKLLAFLQRHADYRTGISFWRKAKIAEALQISESTFHRALRELRASGFVTVEQRYDENGRQKSNRYCVRMNGRRVRCPVAPVRQLRHGALKVYLQLVKQCGRESFAISRRSLALRCKLSMRSVSRIVRDLREHALIRVRAENRMHIFGNPGQTFNRFWVLSASAVSVFRRLLIALLTTPLVMRDTPMNEVPMVTVERKKQRGLLIATVKRITNCIAKRTQAIITQAKLLFHPRR